MMVDSKTIQAIALQYKDHPIHVKMFILKGNLFNSSKKEDYFKAYSKYLDNKPKPFVKWVGGKRQLAQQFRDMDLYPPDGFNPETATYYEPFVGGGGQCFYKWLMNI
jgi:hypothetical protein